MTDITITTTDSLEGRAVIEYLGVSGEAVIGANVVSDMAAGIRNVVGGRRGSVNDPWPGSPASSQRP